MMLQGRNFQSGLRSARPGTAKSCVPRVAHVKVHAACHQAVGVQPSWTMTSGCSSFVNGAGLKLRMVQHSSRIQRVVKPTRAYKR